MNFTHDEMNLMCIYNTGTREGLMDALTAMREYLEPEETELRDMTDSVLEKLEAMTDAEFEALELYADFDDAAAEIFERHMKDHFGCSDEIIAKWITFAKECVGYKQYADYTPAPEDEAVAKWLRQIYATLCLVQIEGGNELANSIMKLTAECCLYPEEIAGTLQLLTLGIEPDNLAQKALDGELETESAFEKKFNLEHIRTLDYDEADDYFKNYKCRFNVANRRGMAGKSEAKPRKNRGEER